MEFKKYLIEAAEKINIMISNEQAENFEKYKDLLLEWNKVMNLTAVIEEKEVIIKHFVDSLTCAKYIDANQKVIDVGSGAGFPGIPLKIFYGEQIDVSLVDALAKRLKFLDTVIEKLNLRKTITIHARAEDIGNNKAHREQYDVVVSRAVADLAILVEYCLPLAKNGGSMLAMKGKTPEEETESAKKAIEVLGGKIETIERIDLPTTDISHTIIVIRKIKNTPLGYPRKAGKVEKSPIR